MYEVMAVWQTLPTHDQPSFIADFVNIWGAADKVVYSKNLKAASTPRTRIEQHFEPEAVQRMKASATQDLAIGGPTLAAHAFQGWPGRRLSLVHCDAALLGMVLVLSRAASPLSWHSRVNVDFATTWFTYTTNQQEARASNPGFAENLARTFGRIAQATTFVLPVLIVGLRQPPCAMNH
jgi:hypothetical protein